MMIRSVCASALVACCCGSAFAVDVPFTETFSTGNANWRTSDSLTPATWNSVGGGAPDNAGFISTTRSFVNDPASQTAPPVLLNALSNLIPSQGASGGLLFGNWATSGVTTFTFDIRHNAPVALTAFARFARATNFPGATAVGFVPVQPNVWTTITINISPTSPNFVSFENSNYNTVFGVNAAPGFQAIGRVQLGVFVPQSLAFTTPTYTFEFDNVRVIPSPSAAGLMVIGLCAGGRRRR